MCIIWHLASPTAGSLYYLLHKKSVLGKLFCHQQAMEDQHTLLKLMFCVSSLCKQNIVLSSNPLWYIFLASHTKMQWVEVFPPLWLRTGAQCSISLGLITGALECYAWHIVWQGQWKEVVFEVSSNVMSNDLNMLIADYLSKYMDILFGLWTELSKSKREGRVKAKQFGVC